MPAKDVKAYINRVGRPKIDRGLRDLIQRMSRENSLWGASRIHGELLMLGFEVAQSTVSKYMTRPSKPPSQSWKTFLRNHAQAVAGTLDGVEQVVVMHARQCVDGIKSMRHQRGHRRFGRGHLDGRGSSIF